MIALLLALTSLADEPASPHGDPTACAACHEMDGDVAGAALPIVATCRGCHPTADMHPVGMAPDQVHVAAAWPLEDGLMTCATCHVEPAHGGDSAIPAPYHRGGPYENTLDLCYSCHERADYTRDDPHHPGVRRDPADGTCTACHTAPPAQGAAPEQANLREGAAHVCDVCHKAPVHAGVADHLGEVVDPSRVGALPASVAVLESGAVACWSCHEVHGESHAAAARGKKPLADALSAAAVAGWGAVVPDGATLPGAAIDPQHPPMLGLPVSDGALCAACHGDGP